MSVNPTQSSRTDKQVVLDVTRIERTTGPMHETHHWHAVAWFGADKVCDCWCYTRAIAMEEAVSALEEAGVEGLGDE